MKSAIRICLTILFVVVAATLFHFVQKPGSTVPGSIASEAAAPLQETKKETELSPADTPEVWPVSAETPPGATSDQHPAASNSPANMAATYAQTLQTGVFGEEPMPLFAQLYLFPTEAARQAAIASQEEFRGSSIDQWSGLMEEQLRAAFGSHPFMANVRVAIMCRATQCRLQFVEPTVRGQPEGELGPNSLMMMLRVAREPWFPENFLEWKTQAATPPSARVAFQLVVLPRRFPQP